ncbi:MAG: serine hydrolase domain-containing protein [Gemmatimonadota bacterium]|jgi:CubicO group peptidase (beta-lactamase class C family)
MRYAGRAFFSIGLCLALTTAFDSANLAGQLAIPKTSTLPGIQDTFFPYASPEELGLAADPFRDLSQTVEEWVREEQIVGAEMLLVKDGRIVFHEAIGWSDKAAGVALERNSIYRIRSMTKPFTGTSIFLLKEAGELELDDPVSKYLPSWRNERSGEITIRQLLSHSGGFVQGGFAGPFQEYRGLREAVDAVGEAGPQNTPGDRYEYSDVGSATLGAIVEEISGMPVERFIETRILEPLGFSDTYTGFTPDAPWAGRMNPTYVKANPDAPWFQYWHPSREQQFPFFRASGGLYTTVFDYARWLHLWMNRGTTDAGPFLSEETAVEVLQPAMTPSYGLHWEIFSPLPEDGTLPAFGHGGSDGTLAVAMPELDAVALIFTQSRGNGVLRRFIPLARAALQPRGTIPH